MSEERVERLLAEVHDDFGMIRVLEVADYRFLEFGDAIEQSCVFTADPSWLEYDYTRAMLIGALCHEAARKRVVSRAWRRHPDPGLPQVLAA